MDLTEKELQGYYLAHEAGRLAGVSGNKIGQWARRGYIRSSQSSRVPRVYSFQDVIEAMMVHELIDHHVSHQEIRRAITAIIEHKAADVAWPLSTVEGLGYTRPGVRRKSGRPAAGLVIEEGGRPIRPARSWKQGMLDFQLVRIEQQLRRGGWAARDLPDLQFIEVDPDRLSGTPTIRGRRVAVEDVARLAADPNGEDVLREGYGLSAGEIKDAVRWWRAVQGYEEAA